MLWEGEFVMAFMRAVLSIHEHANYPRYRYAMHDMSGVSHFDFTAVNMIQMVAQELGARYTNETIKASVVTSSGKIRELVREFSKFTQIDVGLFQTLAQAREWSGCTQ
jgi:uncharacterized protein (DUF2164 family)